MDKTFHSLFILKLMINILIIIIILTNKITNIYYFDINININYLLIKISYILALDETDIVLLKTYVIWKFHY